MEGFLKKLRRIFRAENQSKKLTEIKDKSFKEVTFVVLDIESSGLEIGKDKILSFGGIKIENGAIQVGKSLEKVFQQKKDTVNENTKIHGILNRETAGGEAKATGLKEVMEFIGDAIIVGHHIDFDYGMLSNAFEKYFGKPLDNLKLDTAALAIRLEKGAFAENFPKGEFGLDELALRYKIDAFDRHTAPGDAFITAQLLIKLNALAESKGLKTVGQLLEKRKSGLF